MIAVAVLILLVVLLFVTSSSGIDIPIPQTLAIVVLFLVAFGAGVHIASIMGGIAILTGLMFSDRPFWLFAGQTFWSPSTSFVLVAVPLFLFMGEILLRSGLSGKLFTALNLYLHRLPGGLLHTNVAASGLFAAISGSSIATAATISSVALPHFDKTQHDKKMVLGSLAAGGAIGMLIPPGITFIVYGMITETSVGKLYAAALIPACLTLLLFGVVIVIHGMRHPLPREASASWGMKLRALWDLAPTFVLILMVLGSIYGGLATPTEAAALGVGGAMIFTALSRKLTLGMVNEAAKATAKSTALLGLIIMAAYLLNYVLTLIHVPQFLAQTISQLNMPNWGIMLVIIGLYLALGTFMDGFSMVITTVPVLFPVVESLGYHPIWFGVMVTMLVEIALISPPDGAVNYVLQGMRTTPGPITDIFKGVMPFLFAYLLAVVLMLLYPAMATWLPSMM